MRKAKRRAWWLLPNARPWNTEEEYRRQLERHRKTTKHYPCGICGNPRRWIKKITRQERISAEVGKAVTEVLGRVQGMRDESQR